MLFSVLGSLARHFSLEDLSGDTTPVVLRNYSDFLPVYHPNEEEKRNPKLFADNVRAVMAKTLNVPTTNHSYEDCRYMTLAKKHGLPFTDVIVEFSRLQKRLLYMRHDVIPMLNWMLDTLHNLGDKVVSLQELSCNICMTDNEPLVERIFRFYDKNNTGFINIKDLFCHLTLYSLPFQRKLALEYILQAYKFTDQCEMLISSCVLQKTFMLSTEEANEILSIAKSHHSPNQSFLYVLNEIMEMAGGPFDMYCNFYNEFNKSIKNIVPSCVSSQQPQYPTATTPPKFQSNRYKHE